MIRYIAQRVSPLSVARISRFASLLLVYLLFAGSAAHALEKVVLQLKWEHEFQFAGYYAAKWYGYYEREGLDVEIRSAAMPEGGFVDPVEELLESRAQFAVGALDILIGRGQGKDLVALAPIFQRSALAVYALADTELVKPADLLTLRTAMFENAYWNAEVRAMLRVQNVDPERLNRVSVPPTVDSLVEGSADAIVAYGVSAQTRAQELGVTLRSLQPADFGVQVYGDTLFTSGTLSRERGELVDRFLRASLAGWHHAMQNRHEVADRISAALPRYVLRYANLEQYNRNFADRIDEYTYYPRVNIGTSERNRWLRTYRMLLDGGFIDQPYAIDELFHVSASKPDTAQRADWIDLAWLLGLLILLGAAWWWRRSGFKHVSILLVGSIFLGEVLIEWRFEQERAHAARLEVVEQLGAIRARIEATINNNLSLTNGLAAFVAANPQMNQQQFAAYAKSVILREPSLINLAAAPDMVVRYVYPLKGNEAVLGLDYRRNPAQQEAAERVMQTGEMIVAGPVDLVQGGRGFIGRVPVYIDDVDGSRRTWGIVSAPIGVEAAFRSAGIDAALEQLHIAIRGTDGRGEQGEVFYGEANLFDRPDVVTMPILIGGGSWQIAGVTRLEQSTSFGLWVIRVSALGLLLLAITAVRSRARQRAQELEYSRVIQRQANEDTLTGLPNRTAFRERLASAIARSERSGASHAVLFIDLDEFKSVNDNLGHDAGDQLLIEAARRIRLCLRASDTVARLGGDEFIVLLYDVNSQDSVSRVAENIVATMAQVFAIGASEIFCSVSVGLAVYPEDARDADTLIIKADQAMYSVKQSGRNGWHFYTREMHERSERRHRLFNELTVALDREEIVPHLQPIVCLKTNAIVACEALARWQRSDGSWVSPAEFVEVAEERGLVNRLDYAIMHAGVESMCALNEQLGLSVGLSVNVSPRIFLSRNQDLQRWMDLVRSSARELRISVEITERLLVGESDEARRALDEIAAAQASISIDDFGTGYSSLGYLTRFPVDTIKIDRSFTRGIGLDSASETLIETIVVMAQRLGKKVVAEGVETAAQRDYLRNCGCDFAQGYLFARPMAASALGQYLREYQASVQQA